MAYARYGAKSPQWWVHLRDWKRVYWKRVRSRYVNSAQIEKEFG